MLKKKTKLNSKLNYRTEKSVYWLPSIGYWNLASVGISSSNIVCTQRYVRHHQLWPTRTRNYYQFKLILQSDGGGGSV